VEVKHCPTKNVGLLRRDLGAAQWRLQVCAERGGHESPVLTWSCGIRFWHSMVDTCAFDGCSICLLISPYFTPKKPSYAKIDPSCGI
jgi:hypothetical protein